MHRAGPDDGPGARRMGRAGAGRRGGRSIWREPRRIGLELRLAGLRAEIIVRSCAPGAVLRRPRIDRHAADRIDRDRRGASGLMMQIGAPVIRSHRRRPFPRMIGLPLRGQAGSASSTHIPNRSAAGSGERSIGVQASAYHSVTVASPQLDGGGSSYAPSGNRPGACHRRGRTSRSATEVGAAPWRVT